MGIEIISFYVMLDLHCVLLYNIACLKFVGSIKDRQLKQEVCLQ